ncbi:MAG: hypothetical protein LH481_02130, partial [Burkholderiales bacterium]|nr:hypothetical protein [Burkholderiales bacterium]
SLPPGMCQLEIEQRQFHNRVERDVMPVCNIWFDAEIGIGHQRVAVRDAPRADSIVYQLKKVFATADASEWAFGIGAATVRAVNTSEKSGTRQHYINALLSRQFGAMALHANLGGVVDREAEPGTRRNRLTWALAAEYETTLRWTLVGEVLGQRGQPATAQVGLRWWALPKYVQFTTSLGAQRGSGRDGRWMSFGIRFETGDPVIW